MKATASLLAGALLLWAAWRVPTGKSQIPQDPKPVDAQQQQRVQLALHVAGLRERAAFDQALARLDQRFASAQAGVEPFARDLTAWSTRLGVLARSGGQAWDRLFNDSQDLHRVRDYIRSKFEIHVLSQVDLTATLEGILQGFQEDLLANENLFLADLHGQSMPAGMPAWNARDAAARVAGQTDVLLNDLGSQSLASGAAALAASAAGEELTRRLVITLLTEAASSLAVMGGMDAMALAGSMGSSATLGGSGGASVGPAGAIVGLGVGMVIGAAVDWWLTQRFEEQVAGQCRQFLSQLRIQLRDGSREAPGLAAVLADALVVHHEALERAAAGDREGPRR